MGRREGEGDSLFPAMRYFPRLYCSAEWGLPSRVEVEGKYTNKKKRVSLQLNAMCSQIDADLCTFIYSACLPCVVSEGARCFIVSRTYYPYSTGIQIQKFFFPFKLRILFRGLDGISPHFHMKGLAWKGVAGREESKVFPSKGQWPNGASGGRSRFLFFRHPGTSAPLIRLTKSTQV